MAVVWNSIFWLFKTTLSSSKIHKAVVKSLEIIGHVTNCCKETLCLFKSLYQGDQSFDRVTRQKTWIRQSKDSVGSHCPATKIRKRDVHDRMNRDSHCSTGYKKTFARRLTLELYRDKESLIWTDDILLAEGCFNFVTVYFSQKLETILSVVNVRFLQSGKDNCRLQELFTVSLNNRSLSKIHCHKEL